MESHVLAVLLENQHHLGGIAFEMPWPVIAAVVKVRFLHLIADILLDFCHLRLVVNVNRTVLVLVESQGSQRNQLAVKDFGVVKEHAGTFHQLAHPFFFNLRFRLNITAGSGGECVSGRGFNGAIFNQGFDDRYLIG